MARKSKGGGKEALLGPFYTRPGNTVGPCEVGGPEGGKSPADPLGLVKVKGVKG